MFKKAKCVLLSAVMALSMGLGVVSASANELEFSDKVGEDVILRYTYAASVDNTIRRSGNNITCKTEAIGKSDCTKIIIYQYLEYYNSGWKNVTGADWSGTKTASSYTSYTFTNSESVSTKTKYRVRSVSYFYSGNSSERLESYSDEITYS